MRKTENRIKIVDEKVFPEIISKGSNCTKNKDLQQ